MLFYKIQLEHLETFFIKTPILWDFFYIKVRKLIYKINNFIDFLTFSFI